MEVYGEIIVNESSEFFKNKITSFILIVDSSVIYFPNCSILFLCQTTSVVILIFSVKQAVKILKTVLLFNKIPFLVSV